MASETTPPTPPPLVRIVYSPYDSDHGDEFVGATSPNSLLIHPMSERQKARARGGSKNITFLDEISRNAAGLQSFGQSMAVHANHTLQRLVAPEEEESDGYDSDDSHRRWRKSKLDLLMVKALDGADRYATALCNGCIGANANGFICGEDDYSSDSSWSSFEEVRPRRERRSRTTTTKKKKKKKSVLKKRNNNMTIINIMLPTATPKKKKQQEEVWKKRKNSITIIDAMLPAATTTTMVVVMTMWVVVYNIIPNWIDT
jgi:hypothetical protein